ncbi:Hypothetical predicted protein [Cloeon dipterum]|uniref:L-Fucosyltransferase n=1 Tax=Cloeon dipterum TaxID=197152 RepID=A0A8S1C9Z5_9INSE|nr:Hypothetical predicted protein [Cloeon dipterum]
MLCRSKHIAALLVISGFFYLIFLWEKFRKDFYIPPPFEECLDSCIVSTQPVDGEIEHGRIQDLLDLREVVAHNGVRSNPWKECPVPGRGRESTFITAQVIGRLGNVVWSYLSVVATAKQYKLRPVIDKASIDFLKKMGFKESSLRVPSVEWLDRKCGMNGWLVRTYADGAVVLNEKRDLFLSLEQPPTEGYAMLSYHYYASNAEEIIPIWSDIRKELVLRDKYTLNARRSLDEMKKKHLKGLVGSVDPEFVGLHVRRTDYLRHLSIVHPNGMVASPKYYHTAMDWLKKQVDRSLIFIVISDDPKWAETEIVDRRSDAYLPGSGDIYDPGLDLALFAACNHTIFAYGTFALTGALLASRPGSFTVVFDPLNGTITKEMEYASNLPGWRIMDEDGNLNYDRFEIKFRYAYG